jgi:hypothetical protein
MSFLLLVPSPLLGPATWLPVAGWLHERGCRAGIVEYADGPRTPRAVLDAVVRAGAAADDLVLVAHSNAGLYVPRLSELIAVRATVYVDAALAGDAPDVGLAPEPFLAVLRELADDDGLLPPWTHWWDQDELSGLFPDDVTREAVEAEQPRLPLAYFTSSVPVRPGWAELPSAYLAFGDTYAEEVVFAEEHGWPVRTLPGRHLHQLHDPAGVGAEILQLTALLRG